MAVPITEPAWVRFTLSSPVVTAWAMPKSATFTCPVEVMRMLPGFTSRWTTPLRWAKASAAATSAATSAARSGCNGPSERMISESGRLSTYSMTMKYVSYCEPQS